MLCPAPLRIRHAGNRSQRTSLNSLARSTSTGRIQRNAGAQCQNAHRMRLLPKLHNNVRSFFTAGCNTASLARGSLQEASQWSAPEAGGSCSPACAQRRALQKVDARNRGPPGPCSEQVPPHTRPPTTTNTNKQYGSPTQTSAGVSLFMALLLSLLHKRAASTRENKRPLPNQGASTRRLRRLADVRHLVARGQLTHTSSICRSIRAARWVCTIRREGPPETHPRHRVSKQQTHL